MGALDFLFGGQTPQNVTTTGSSATAIPQWLSDYAQSLVGKANAVAATPYQAYTGPRVAGQTGDQTTAEKMRRDNAGAYTPAMQAALSNTQGVPGAAAPLYSDAASATRGAIAPGSGGLSAAQPWMNKAGGSFTGSTVSDYMNPYTSNVIDASTNDALRTWNNSILPGLNDTFIGNGQFGSSPNAQKAYGAGVDLTTGIQKNALGALSQAYDSARGAYQTDTSRYAGLGATAGQLGVSDANAKLQAGQQFGQIAGSQGALGLSAAGQTGALAQDAQRLGINDASALAASGTDQQAQIQKSLDQAYADFVAQRDYGKNQIGFMGSAISGLPYNQQSSSVSTGPGSTFGPSVASQLGSLYSIYKGVTTPAAARGGLMRAYARGGLVKRGGLVALEA